MKIPLDPTERMYLNTLIKAVHASAKRIPITDENRTYFRKVSKMKEKFNGQGTYVWLTQPEIALLEYILAVRESVLIAQNSISEEMQVIESAKGKLNV